MFETLPQRPQHPQSFELFQQQQQHRQDAYRRTRWMPASPSPLGLCGSSSSNINVNIFPHASTVFAGGNMGDSTDKENHNISKGGGEERRNIATTTTNTTPTSSRQSTYEQRFKSATASSRPFVRLFGSSPTQSSSTSPSSSSAISAAAAARSTKQRTLFLNRVNQNRDTARFNARGDSLMMMEHLSEQRDWREAMRRRADALFHELQIEEEDKDDDDNGRITDMGMEMDAEQYALALQEQEMEALLENMPVDNGNDAAAQQDCSFSDEEIDNLFDRIAEDGTQDMDMSG